MTLAEIKKFFEDGKDDKDIQTYISGLNPITADRVTEFLETKEGKKLLQPTLDAYHTKGLETWKEKNLKKIEEDIAKKLNPEETAEQKQIREMSEKIAKMEADTKKSTYQNKALKDLTDKKMPSGFAKFLTVDNEDAYAENLALLEGAWAEHQKTIEGDKQKAAGRKVDNNPALDKTKTNDCPPAALRAAGLIK